MTAMLKVISTDASVTILLHKRRVQVSLWPAGCNHNPVRSLCAYKLLSKRETKGRLLMAAAM